MIKKVLKVINEYHMCSPHEKVLAAVSGGADSVGLLVLLYKLQQVLGIEIKALHVHHGIRGSEADRDAQYVKDLCERLNIPVEIKYEKVIEYSEKNGLSLEEGGRILRYRALETAALEWGARTIAVAHHGGDQVETILHNLFRGSGIRGLCGMQPVRQIANTNIKVIRPLLFFEKDEIIQFLREEQISYCSDSTNELTDYTRNKLRNQIIPEIISGVNRQAASHIISAGKLLLKAEEFIEKTAKKVFDENVKHQNLKTGIDCNVLKKQEEIIVGYVLRMMMEEVCGSKKDITLDHINSICKLSLGPTGKSIDLPYQMKCEKSYDMLWISIKDDKEQDGLDQEDHLKMEVSAYNKEEIPEKLYTKWFDYDKIINELSVRTRKTGDYISLPGGKTKTVKSYMIDEKIPREDRNKITLLAENSHILWIVGYRISDFYKVTKETKKILKVTYDGGKENG